MPDLMWARDAERTLLGSLLIEPKRVQDLGGLTADAFDPALGHPAIFTAITRVIDLPHADHTAVLAELVRTGNAAKVGRGTGGAYLHELIEQRGVGDLMLFARQVAQAAARRRIAYTARRIAQMVETQGDWDTAMTGIATEAIALETAVDDPLDDGEIRGLALLGDFVDRPRRSLPWVVPGLLRRQERVLLIARPGIGKSMLGRQLVTCIASGLHPFEPRLHMPAQTTLLVDLENPDDIIADKTRPMITKARQTGLYAEDGAWIWHRPEGIDIRTAPGFRELERVMEQTNPAFVSIGPLYKLTVKGGDDWETVAEQTARALDRIRVRFDCALWIEHHMPKGADQKTPFGSSLWARWPEFGKELAAPDGDDPTFTLDEFRPDRDERSWPAGLYRGGEWPWTAMWDTRTGDALRAMIAAQRKDGAA